MRMRRVFRWFFLFADRDPTILPGRREKRRWESMIAGVGTLGTDTSYCFPRLICSCSIQDNIYSDLFPTTLIFKQTLSSFQLMIFPRLMLKINTFNKLLAERSLDSHMLWKGALRWDLNNVKKAFHLNDNQLIMIISQCRIQGRGPGGPGPLISGSGWPAPPPPPLMSRSGSGIQRWREERREKWPANYWKTLARRKGQDEWCAQNRRTLAEREAAFSILAQVFSFSMLCISTEPAPQAYPLWNVSAEKRHMPVHRWFFPL